MRAGTLVRWHALKHILESEINSHAVIIDIGGYDGFSLSKIRKNHSRIIGTVVDIDQQGLSQALGRK